MHLRFQSFESCRRHLIWHVLSPDEAHAWYFVWQGNFPELEPSPAGGQACYELRRAVAQMSENDAEPKVGRYLLREYLTEIRRQFIGARNLGWYFENHHGSICLGINGLLAIAQKRDDQITLVTAYLPGFGDSTAVIRSQQDPSDIDARVKRKSQMRSAAADDKWTDSAAQLFDRERWEAWSAEERIYYLVFRPVLKFLRGNSHWTERSSLLTPADLKPWLPSMGRIKFQHWLEIFQQAVATESPAP